MPSAAVQLLILTQLQLWSVPAFFTTTLNRRFTEHSESDPPLDSSSFQMLSWIRALETHS